jgi:hypothetical protein
MKKQTIGFYLPVIAGAIAFLPLWATTGCAAHFQAVDGYDAEYVDAAPANIEVYPRYEVADGYVYQANGRYYHRHGDRWVVYRNPPPAVGRQRGYVQHAPPAHEGWR